MFHESTPESHNWFGMNFMGKQRERAEQEPEKMLKTLFQTNKMFQLAKLENFVLEKSACIYMLKSQNCCIKKDTCL